MKGHSILPSSPELELHYLMQFSVISRTHIDMKERQNMATRREAAVTEYARKKKGDGKT